MKKLLAVSALGLLGMSAFAQDAGTPLTFRLGVAFPTLGTTKDAVNQMTAFGFQYKLSDLKSTGMFNKSTEISLDYYGRGDYRHVPILFNYVGTSVNSMTFWSVGAGVGFIGEPDGSGTHSIARFAYSASLGLNLSTGQTASFVEAKYFGSEDTAVNAIGVYLGVRF